MEESIKVVTLTLMAGLAMPLGASVASVERIKQDWLETELRHGILAFGGGALLSAVALVLIPEGIANLSISGVSIAFTLGGITFLALDVTLDKLNSPMSQLVAMMSDFIPEALALGAAIAIGSDASLLLAGLMALQNLPEGFNAFREMEESQSFSGRKIIVAFSVLALLGPVCGVVGFYFLANKPLIVSTIMVFAAGGILYIVFSDIAPQAKVHKQWLPPMGAVAGFLLGLVGQMVSA